jgi:hypothetical protein
MKTIRRNWITAVGICVGGLVIVATAITALSQTTPGLSIARTGTNQLFISITNGISTNNYDLYWTPVLANQNYPWTVAGVGTPGQTNFTVSMSASPAGFYRVLVDDYTIPLWEAADPNNQSAGILSVFIDSPTNGAVLQ